MPRAVYFDISAMLALLEGDSNVLKVIEESVDFYTGTIQMAELLGAKSLSKKAHSELRLLINNLTVLDFDIEDALKISDILKKAKDAGMDYSFETLASLAQSGRRGLNLVTKDHEFKKFKEKDFHIQVVT